MNYSNCFEFFQTLEKQKRPLLIFEDFFTIWEGWILYSNVLSLFGIQLGTCPLSLWLQDHAVSQEMIGWIECGLHHIRSSTYVLEVHMPGRRKYCLSKLVLKYPRSQPLPISFMVSIIHVEAGQLDTSMSLAN